MTNMEVNAAKDSGIWSHWIGELQVVQLKGLEVSRSTFAVLFCLSYGGVKLLEPKNIVRRVCPFGHT